MFASPFLIKLKKKHTFLNDPSFKIRISEAQFDMRMSGSLQSISLAKVVMGYPKMMLLER